MFPNHRVGDLLHCTAARVKHGGGIWLYVAPLTHVNRSIPGFFSNHNSIYWTVLSVGFDYVEVVSSWDCKDRGFVIGHHWKREGLPWPFEIVSQLERGKHG